MDAAFTSHQHRINMKTGPSLKVQYERPKKRGIKHAAPEMVDLGVMHYINAASICELVNRFGIVLNFTI